MNAQQLEELQSKHRQWSDYNAELLLRLFDDDTIREEYSAFYGGSFSMRPTFADRIGYKHRDIKSSLTRLRSILGRIDLFEESGALTSPISVDHRQVTGTEVFIVHGHDELAKQSCARLVENLGLEAIILHEQTNEGRTIIEKFEDSSDVSFAIILLTPDDTGKSQKVDNAVESDRARQNVIFEHGYFIGKLGRNRVCALYVQGVELPSDMSGIIYVPYDESGNWKYQLSKEMKAAGLDVDLNNVR